MSDLETLLGNTILLFNLINSWTRVILTRRPEYIIWIFTASCNLDCLHCYTYRFRGLKELPLEKKLSIVRDIGESGIEYVNLTGGEPLVHPHIADLLLELHRYGVEKSIVTNATVVLDRYLDTLYRTETFVFATIEGPREIHDEIRGRGTYDAAVKGIEKIKRRLSSFSIVATVNKLNYKRVHEVVDYAAHVDADELALLPIMPSGKALITKVYVDATEYAEAVRKTHERAREQGVRLSTWCTPFAPLLKRDVGFWFCRDMRGIDIDPEGNVLLCDILDFRVSSVVDKGIIKAFEEFSEHELVKAVKKPPSLPMPCRECEISAFCRGGCFSRAYVLRGGLNEGDPLCPRVAGIKV